MFGFEEDPSKKFSSEECLQFLIDDIKANPGGIRTHANTMTDAESDQLNRTLMPAAVDPNAWFRESTHRPSVRDYDEEDENAVRYSRDAVIRKYVNEIWEDNGRRLEALVVSEYGELRVEFNVEW